MTDIRAEDLRAELLPIAEGVRAKLRANTLPSQAVARYDAILETLGHVFIFLDKAIKKGEIDMKTLKDSVNVQIVRISEIESRARSSEVQDKIMGWVKDLQDLISDAEKAKGYDPRVDKPALRIDPAEMQAAYLNSLVTEMRKDKKIPQNIRVTQRKTDKDGKKVVVGYLIELEPEIAAVTERRR